MAGGILRSMVRDYRGFLQEFIGLWKNGRLLRVYW